MRRGRERGAARRARTRGGEEGKEEKRGAGDEGKYIQEAGRGVSEEGDDGGDSCGGLGRGNNRGALGIGRGQSAFHRE